MRVVLVVLVVVLYFKDDNSNNLYNKESCSCCFGCRAFIRPPTGTTSTTLSLVSVVLVVVFLLDDNRHNLYNIVGCSCCYGCRLQIIWLSYDIAHLSENVNFAAQNVKRPRPPNRRRKRAPRAQNRTSSPLFGRQIFLLGRQKIL